MKGQATTVVNVGISVWLVGRGQGKSGASVPVRVFAEVGEKVDKERACLLGEESPTLVLGQSVILGKVACDV